MNKLINFKTLSLQIAELLTRNDDFKKLLFHDEANALTLDAPKVSINELIKSGYIAFYPPEQTDETHYHTNTSLTVLLSTMMFDDDSVRGNYSIFLATDSNHILLDNNKNRLLEMADIAIDLLDGCKLANSVSIKVQSLDHVMIDNFKAAYRILISIEDQQTDQGLF